MGHWYSGTITNDKSAASSTYCGRKEAVSCGSLNFNYTEIIISSKVIAS